MLVFHAHTVGQGFDSQTAGGVPFVGDRRFIVELDAGYPPGLVIAIGGGIDAVQFACDAAGQTD